MFQSLESKVVSASSTLKVSNVVSGNIITGVAANESYSVIKCVTILEATTVFSYTVQSIILCKVGLTHRHKGTLTENGGGKQRI